MNVHAKAALILSEVIQKKITDDSFTLQKNNKEQSLLQKLYYGVLRWLVF